MMSAQADKILKGAAPNESSTSRPLGKSVSRLPQTYRSVRTG
jgi:hypothetical protein